MCFNQEHFGQCTASLNALAAYIKAEYAGIAIMYGDAQHFMHPILVHREQEEYNDDDDYVTTTTTTLLEGAGGAGGAGGGTRNVFTANTILWCAASMASGIVGEIANTEAQLDRVHGDLLFEALFPGRSQEERQYVNKCIVTQRLRILFYMINNNNSNHVAAAAAASTS